MTSAQKDGEVKKEDRVIIAVSLSDPLWCTMWRTCRQSIG